MDTPDVVAVPKSKVGLCAVDVMRTTNSLMDAGLYLWAADKRCGKSYIGLDYKKMSPAATQSQGAKCVADISSVVESVSLVAAHILRAVNNCGGVKEQSHQCASTVLKLTAGAAKLTAASATMTYACKSKKTGGRRLG